MPGARQLFDPEAPPGEATPGSGPPVGADAEDRRGVHSIGGLYEQVEGALNQVFPRNRHLWVRGEIQHVSDHRSGHLYMSLVDPEDDGARRDRGRGGVPTLNVKCWRSSWAPLRHGLAKEGIELAEGMVVVLRGSLDLYRAKGEISLILAEVDVTALLGRLAAQRTQLLRTLESEGLLRRNAALPMPEVPLHVGLVASPGTEGCRDFLGQLTGRGSGSASRTCPSRCRAPVRRPPSPRALTALSRSDCDVIAVVRGGGAGPTWPPSRAEVVARAVAVRPNPSSPGSGTPVTGRWPTSLRHVVHHADRMRAGDRGGDPALVGGPRGGARRAPVPRVPAYLATPSPATPRPVVAYRGGPAAAPGASGAPGHQGVGHRTGGTGPAPDLCEAGPRPTPSGSGRSAWATSGTRTSAWSRGGGSWPPTTWTVSSNGATA